MVFVSDANGNVLNWEELDRGNYTTESQASEEHEKMVAKWKNM